MTVWIVAVGLVSGVVSLGCLAAAGLHAWREARHDFDARARGDEHAR